MLPQTVEIIDDFNHQKGGEKVKIAQMWTASRCEESNPEYYLTVNYHAACSVTKRTEALFFCGNFIPNVMWNLCANGCRGKSFSSGKEQSLRKKMGHEDSSAATRRKCVA